MLMNQRLKCKRERSLHMNRNQFNLQEKFAPIFKNRASGVSSSRFRYCFTCVLMLTGILFSLLLVQSVWAWDGNYLDDFDPDPLGSGVYSNVVNTGDAATGMTYTFTSDGDGPWNGTEGFAINGNKLEPMSGAFNVGTTERITIESRDGKAFVFHSIYIDINPSTGGSGFTIQGNGPEPFTKNTGAPGTAATYSPDGGAKLVTDIEITSVDFYMDWFDNLDLSLDVPGCALYGNGQLITNGDAVPSTSDHTDFGSNITSPVDRTFTIENIGDASLDLDGSPYVTLDPNPSGKFSVQTQPSTDPIGVGGSTTFVIRCAPTEPGEITATLNISNNSEADDYTFNIKGTGDASLPVGLSSFSARCKGQAIILEWITESETNNLGFILERCEEDIWTEIASYKTNNGLKGQGNTSSRTEYSFMDQDVESGKEYSYRLSDVSTKGKITVYGSLSITMDNLPEITEMENAWPNPFNPKTFISYHLSEDTQVAISVFDLLGRQVKSLYDGHQLAGSYQVYWNGTNENGATAPTGAYLIRMQTENTTQVQKILFMK